ncbi:MAG: L,D-transpeptidase family protein [Sulfuricurvum sp.]|jgi:L,D-peptidoglycan transpeptidase YkuD (ErfK/YbiS/YcfS/YnhG family)|nr:L,D-transpeptidase family protein [Sulfuricurvum sp.]
MFKSILSFIASFVCPSEQLVVVVSNDINATSGVMQRYEKRGEWEKVGERVPVTLGRGGMGYASLKEPLKREGDGRTPLGVFEITSAFGYSETGRSKLPYLYADETLICVDDPQDGRYNTIIRLEGEAPKSFERMRREDDVYRHGAVIGYNPAGEKGRGSCIFLHLNHADGHPTSGCTAMNEADLVALLEWLDAQKKPKIVQIPKNECGNFKKEFEGIECD